MAGRHRQQVMERELPATTVHGERGLDEVDDPVIEAYEALRERETRSRGHDRLAHRVDELPVIGTVGPPVRLDLYA